MLEKPDISDARIKACLQTDFGLHVSETSFLPLGADVNTAVYRAGSDGGAPWFVKLRSGTFDGASVLVPQHLKTHGVEQIIAPLATLDGQYWTQLENFTVVLYPFVTGENGFDRHLSDQQWIDLGRALREMHRAELPHQLVQQIPRETYSSHWRELVKSFLSRAETEVFDDPDAAQLVEMLRANQGTIRKLVDRAEQLGNRLLQQPRDMVPCHGDIHAGNVLIDGDDHLYLVDWDTLIIAPKERDLMFIGAGIGGVWNSEHEETLFYQGYGSTVVDQVALAYYRNERVVQDIAEFSKQLLMTDEGGEDRKQSLYFFASQFEPNSVADIALQTNRGR